MFLLVYLIKYQSNFSSKLFSLSLSDSDDEYSILQDFSSILLKNADIPTLLVIFYNIYFLNIIHS